MTESCALVRVGDAGAPGIIQGPALNVTVCSFASAGSVLPNRMEKMYRREELESRARRGIPSVRSLGSIRERVAYDLLDRASQSQLVVGRLEVKATQADLADSIGSSREVVSRALRALRVKGIVETAPGVVRILAPSFLASIVGAFVT